MIMITRRNGEEIFIQTENGLIRIEVESVGYSTTRLGIDLSRVDKAKPVTMHRGEIFRAIEGMKGKEK